MEEDKEEDELFVALHPFRRSPGDGWPDRRARNERERERFLAGHYDRFREHGRQPPRRVRGLSRADIVTTAVAVADAEGADAVSMRRLAREMRVGAMSLYWYVSSKDELHELMLERVQAEAQAPEPTGDWRADLRAFASNSRAALLRHPWAMDFLGIGPPTGPNDARNADRLLGALGGLGLDTRTIIWIAMTVGTYVLGATLREVQEARWQQAVDEMKATMTAEEMDRRREAFFEQVAKSGSYPHLAAVFDAGIDPDAPETRDERFEFGLDCLLDGIAARVGG
jgi:AcrR family transcriptional regulator